MRRDPPSSDKLGGFILELGGVTKAVFSRQSGVRVPRESVAAERRIGSRLGDGVTERKLGS